LQCLVALALQKITTITDADRTDQGVTHDASGQKTDSIIG